jgi:hypothetical protein
MPERRRSLEPTAEERIVTLERQVQALAEDYAEQVYGNSIPVTYDAYNGWSWTAEDRGGLYEPVEIRAIPKQEPKTKTGGGHNA